MCIYVFELKKYVLYVLSVKIRSNIFHVDWIGF